MRSNNTHRNAKERVTRLSLGRIVFLTVCAFGAATSLALAQSGRKDSQAPPATPTTQTSQPENDKKDRELPKAFIVMTAEPDYSREAHEYLGYAPVKDLESHARGGCVLELKKIPGVRVVEDEDVPRSEAREVALTEEDAWVVWMELQFEKDTQRRTNAPFKMRYLLFEPRTGRMIASGYGTGVRQTWGTPPVRFSSLEDLAREAGRDVADKLVRDLRTIR